MISARRRQPAWPRLPDPTAVAAGDFGRQGPNRWFIAASKTEAEAVLDWLEGQGHHGGELSIAGNRFIVRLRAGVGA